MSDVERKNRLVQFQIDIIEQKLDTGEFDLCHQLKGHCALNLTAVTDDSLRARGPNCREKEVLENGGVKCVLEDRRPL